MKTVSIGYDHAVDCYNNIVELFRDHMPEFIDTLTEAERLTLEHFLDFESYTFLVLNYETVVTLEDGRVVSIDGLSGFAATTKSNIEEE